MDTLHTRNKENLLLQECVECGRSFVVDNTNPTKEDRQKYIRAAKDKLFYVHIENGKFVVEDWNRRIGRNIMKFDDFDKEMRIYEESLDQYILPDMYIAARLDGRSFTRLTKEICEFEAPFDVKFRDLMVETVKSLMNVGFRIVYGYTESDEISVLFHHDDNTFGRKVRKINTTLAGEASAAFSLALGQAATFDCRVIPLPNKSRVADYFVWRQEDSHRNSLNAHCY